MFKETNDSINDWHELPQKNDVPHIHDLGYVDELPPITLPDREPVMIEEEEPIKIVEEIITEAEKEWPEDS